MICPRCGTFTDDKYLYCINCGLQLQRTKGDEGVDTLARVLLWLTVVGIVGSAIIVIIVLAFFSNLMHTLVP